MVQKKRRTAAAAVIAAGMILAVMITACGGNGNGDNFNSYTEGKRSPKRGICYGTGEALRDHAQNLAVLSSGTSWMYTWGLTPAAGQFATAAATSDIVFLPMIFRGTWNQNDLRTYLSAHPEVEYLLTYNEPMFTDQARMTPQEAAAAWPNVMSIAREFNLKVVGPALNYGRYYDGVPSNMQNPKGWFQTFLNQPGVSLDDMHAIAVHTYSGDPKGQIYNCVVQYAEFGKPLWLTEFCAWEDDWYTKNALHQEKFMSEMIIYLEQEPLVEKYAWFMANGGNNGSRSWPFFNLVDANGLSRLGQIFVNMSTCDKTVWVPAGRIIAAAQFSANHLSEFTGPQDRWPTSAYGSFPGTGTSVHFRPSTDSSDDLQPLDVYNFNGTGKWMEYQVNLPKAKNYTLTLRYRTVQAANVQIFVDGAEKTEAALDSTDWDTQTFSLGNIGAGNRTIRLKANGGNCELNWLKVE